MSTVVVLGQDPGFGGGAATMLRRFAEGAESLGHETEVVYVPHPSFDSRVTSRLERVEALRLARGSVALPAAGDLWVVAGVAAHGYAAARSGRAYSCWIATSLRDENRGRVRGLPWSRRLAAHANEPVLSRLERAVLRGASRVFGISEASRQSLAKAAGLPVDRVGVLPVPVDVERLTSENDEGWTARAQKPVVGFVARGDDPRKNLALTLDAFALIRQTLPDARLRVMGPRPSRALPDGVETTGELASLADPLRECSLFLLTSHQEGFGIVAAEALAAGVPVVSTPSGGPEEMLRQSGGGVTTQGWSAREVADVALGLLGDSQRLLELRHAGMTYVRREHTPAMFADRLREALDD
jgi:glycosyltransferase involved in cell wall biosynthesis